MHWANPLQQVTEKHLEKAFAQGQKVIATKGCAQLAEIYDYCNKIPENHNTCERWLLMRFNQREIPSQRSWMYNRLR